MTTLPEEAVKAAQDAIRTTNWEYGITDADMAKALTAALPFLPVQVAVKKLEWDEDGCAKTPFGMYTVAENAEDTWSFTFYDYPYGIPEGEFGTLDEAKAAAQADYSARILSALEPSAARDLALEEGFRKGLEAACEVIDAHSEYDRRMCCDGHECGCYGATVHQSMQHYIRALSSPDHADAGKVEGDGSRWRVFEAAVGGYWGIELEQASNDDDPILYPIKVHRDTLARIVDAHNAALPSAPSEGAE